MFFKIAYIIKPLNLGKANEVSIDMHTPPHDVRILIEKIPEDRLSKDINRNDLFIYAITQRTLTQKREKQFAEITSTLSNSLKEFMTLIWNDLYDVLMQTINGYRWRLRNESATNPIKFWNFNYYSSDGFNWKAFPISPALMATWGLPVKQEYTNEEFKSIGELLSVNHTEPLGHNLLHEAWDLRRTNPRSSLVIGIAAAETGFKQFCATLAPDASWLIENVPSPPMVKMLEEYLPLVNTKHKIYGHTLPPPEALIKVLKKGIQLRNGVVHGKHTDLKKETVEEILNAVRDLLYLLDFYNGHVWAWEHVNSTYLHELVETAKSKNAKLSKG